MRSIGAYRTKKQLKKKKLEKPLPQPEVPVRSEAYAKSYAISRKQNPPKRSEEIWK